MIIIFWKKKEPQEERQPTDLELAVGRFVFALIERPARFVIVSATRFIIAIQTEFGEND